MLCTNIVLNVKTLYCELADARMRASEKDLAVLTFLLILMFSSLKKYRNKVLESTRTKRTSFYNLFQVNYKSNKGRNMVSECFLYILMFSHYISILFLPYFIPSIIHNNMNFLLHTQICRLRFNLKLIILSYTSKKSLQLVFKICTTFQA